MGLKKQIKEDLNKALKAKEKGKVSVLRMVNAEIKNEEIDKKEDLTDEDIIKIIFKELKKRKEGLEEFKKAGRDLIVKKEEKQIQILEDYLPEQMNKEEVEELVEEVIEETEAKGISDMGKVMKEIMPKVKGKADGKIVNSIVKEKLQ